MATSGATNKFAFKGGPSKIPAHVDERPGFAAMLERIAGNGDAGGRFFNRGHSVGCHLRGDVNVEISPASRRRAKQSHHLGLPGLHGGARWIRTRGISRRIAYRAEIPICAPAIGLDDPVWLLLIFSGRARACSPRRGEAKRKSDQCFALASHRGSRSGEQPEAAR